MKNRHGKRLKPPSLGWENVQRLFDALVPLGLNQVTHYEEKRCICRADGSASETERFEDQKHTILCLRHESPQQR